MAKNKITHKKCHACNGLRGDLEFFIKENDNIKNLESSFGC